MQTLFHSLAVLADTLANEGSRLKKRAAIASAITTIVFPAAAEPSGQDTPETITSAERSTAAGSGTGTPTDATLAADEG